MGVQLIVDVLSELRGPFDGLLEAPSSVNALYRAHADPIRTASGAYRQALLDAGRDALDMAFPGVSIRSTTEEDLYAAGLPRPQSSNDPFDDW